MNPFHLSSRLIAALLVLALMTGVAWASPPQGGEGVSHERWDKILKQYVTEDGWVDYPRLEREAGRELTRYLGELGRVDVARLSRNDQMAFWINAYNALCIQTLLDEDIPDSVPRKSFLGIGTNIFTLDDYRIGGKVRSLDDIEHDILRPRFRDPRVHAALVCGASSCPRLRPEAYDGRRIDVQLDDEAWRWIQSGKDLKGNRKNYLDRARKTFYASKIFDWFDEDFGGDDEGILRFIARFAAPADREFLGANKVRLRFLDYDWTLNRRDPATASAKRR